MSSIDLLLCRDSHAPSSLLASGSDLTGERPSRPSSRWLRLAVPSADANGAYFPSSASMSEHGPTWRIDPGRRAFAPVFYAGARHDLIAISSDPSAIAAIIDAPLDPVAIYQWLAFGFVIGDRTVFEGVKRLSAGEIIEGSASTGAVISRETETFAGASDKELIRQLGSRLAKVCGDRSAIELTGGVDSRLALALCLSSGARPSAAFTIGEPRDLDVLAAAAIASRYRIPHHIEPAIRRWDSLGQDVAAFVSASAFYSNAVEYAWLPTVFRSIEPIRDAQITGGGGEAAHGFYDSSLDPLLRSEALVRAWISLRLRKPGTSPDLMFRSSERRAVRNSAVSDVVAALGDRSSDVRARTASFYVNQRLRNWAAPVLCASSRWYNVAAPFMTDEYLDWAATQTSEARHARAAQRRLMRQAQRDIVELPFASAFDVHGRSPMRQSLQKIRRRLSDKSRIPELHRVVARQLAQDAELVAQMKMLPERCAILDRGSIEQRVAGAAEEPTSFGFLATAAFAEQARRTFCEMWERGHDARGSFP